MYIPQSYMGSLAPRGRHIDPKEVGLHCKDFQEMDSPLDNNDTDNNDNGNKEKQ